eukprot:6468564-Amphidinium_carterae.1
MLLATSDFPFFIAALLPSLQSLKSSAAHSDPLLTCLIEPRINERRWSNNLPAPIGFVCALISRGKMDAHQGIKLQALKHLKMSPKQEKHLTLMAKRRQGSHPSGLDFTDFLAKN